MSFERTIDNSLIVAGTAIGISQIETILGIILLTVQLVWLLVKLTLKLVNTIKKNGNIEEIEDNVEEITGFIGGIIDKISSEEKNGHEDNKS